MNNTDYTIKVIKTATGLVITQMNQGKSGVETIVDKLKTSLATIREFTTNIQTLLTRGFNKEYVRQLLEAGPEAAGATAALLAKSGDDTVTTINDLYTTINKESEQFGAKMSETFYGNSVSMAKALVKGATDEYDSIMKSMKSIADGIMASFAPLADVGTVVGNDIIQDLINSLEARRAELIARANAIAAEIAAAMAAAAGAIGVTVSGTTNPTVIPDVIVTPEPTPDPTPTPTPTPNPVTSNPVTPKAVATAEAAQKYVVKAGDTLSAIAKANSTTLAKILDANPKFEDNPKYKNGNMIWSGTTVVIPPKTVAAAAPTAGGAYNDAQNAYRIGERSTTIEKGAVTVNLNTNVKPADVEPIMTRALLNALSGRAD